jgi:hypothetical protein
MVAFSLFCFAPLLLKNLEDRTVSTRAVSIPFLKTTQTTFGRSRCLLEATAARELLPAIREGVVDAGGEEAWKESVSKLASMMEIDEEEAEILLADATNWKGWAMCSSELMRKYIKPQIPDAQKLEEALEWLQEGPLELDQEQLCTAIREVPKVYLADPQSTYKKALNAAPQEYKKPEIFKALILEDPLVLQCTYNCADGDNGCGSECGNCWVTFQNS